MSTINESIQFLTDSSRFPKRTQNPVKYPQYQISSEEYNRIVEILSNGGSGNVVYMSQSEFDALTDYGSNLDPIRDIEDLRVYEDDGSSPSGGTSARYEDGILTAGGTLTDGVLTIHGTLAEGVLTI